jgi:hypothetical protein
MAEPEKKAIQKRGGASAPTKGQRPTQPPKKPQDAGKSAQPAKGDQ